MATPDAPSLAVSGARVVTPDGTLEDGTLFVEGTKIARISTGRETQERPPADETLDARGLTLLPGFIDVHIHGGGGADTMDATPDALRTICRTHARHGTTCLLLTTMTQSRDAITAALAGARMAFEGGPGFCADGARVLGIHLEGPYLSPKKPGAQPAEWIRDYDPGEFGGWLETSGGAMKLLTMAPEQPGGGALIAAARENGIVVSLGHTDATAEPTRTALEAGATHGTHLFNQMRPFHHRNDSVVNVLLFDARARVELICDGHHLAPEVARLVLQAKGDRGVILITDAMAGADAGDGEYRLGGLRVRVENGRATLDDGTLAGSVLTLDRAAANVRAWTGADWPTLARLVSTNAADQMGWPHKGRIQVGTDADFVFVDDELRVHATFVEGRCVYRSGRPLSG